MQDYNNDSDWKDVLNQLSAIRERQEYATEEVDFVNSQLQSVDERIRSAAALTAEGCIFEPYVIDLLTNLVENDSSDVVRKAAIQSLAEVINEGVIQAFEDDEGADTAMDYYEEWDELQTETLHDDYLRVKGLLLGILQNEFDDIEVRESALGALSDLGFLEEVQEWIADFLDSERMSSQLVSLYAMGKYPQRWEDELAAFLEPGTPKSLLLEAISSSYSSGSAKLAGQIEHLLDTDDPEILVYAIKTLTNINKTPDWGNMLQNFSLHPDEMVRKAAKESIETFSKRSFRNFLEDEFGAIE